MRYHLGAGVQNARPLAPMMPTYGHTCAMACAAAWVLPEATAEAMACAVALLEPVALPAWSRRRAGDWWRSGLTPAASGRQVLSASSASTISRVVRRIMEPRTVGTAGRR